MKTTLKLINLLIIVLLIIAVGCSSDDEIVAEEIAITVEDLAANIDENPSNGDIIGTVETNNTATLNFSITSQTPAGALNINSSTGELTVANATLFDFETNPIITATVSLTDATNTATVTINLNDKDAIQSSLSTSQAAYIAASNGNWVIITEAEYNNLANNLNNITRAGTTETEYSNTYSSQTTGAYIFSNFTTTALIPNNGYIIAFKYKVYIATNKTGVKIKQSSTANNSGFLDLGNALPSHSGSSQDIFFVLKGNNTPITANGYLGFDQPGGSMFLFNITSGNGAYWGASNASNLNGQYGGQQVFYQGLSTTKMQW